MDTNTATPILSDEYWNCSVDSLIHTLQQFVSEFGSFTPEWFAEVKFHLLRQGLNIQSRDELCDASIFVGTCKNCDDLYRTKRCLLWYRLFEIIDGNTVRRAPPCIRNALSANQIKIVARFLKKASLIDPPFFKARMPPRCPKMKEYGHCQPDEYCEKMESNRVLEYNRARERVKLGRSKHNPS
ncbi:MAG: hypothetical protein ACTSUO_08655 [Candidatus Thorarchaeota archaeon]